MALKHPIKLIANALGSPPKDVIDQVHAAGVPVAALAGSAKHAQRHVDNGVDIVVAQGHEAGGHTGEIGSMVLWPEIVDALDGRAPVLAAGGIGTGRQVAAALALGAQGVWMGSAFLTSAEYDLGVRTEAGTSVIQQALLGATSSDTVRRRIYTGKPARLLKSRWTDAWDAADAPEPLPMPLQNILVSEAHQRMSESSDPTAVAMPVGQIVGRMNEIRPVADIIAELVTGFEDATKRLDDIGIANSAPCLASHRVICDRVRFVHDAPLPADLTCRYGHSSHIDRRRDRDQGPARARSTSTDCWAWTCPNRTGRMSKSNSLAATGWRSTTKRSSRGCTPVGRRRRSRAGWRWRSR